MRLSCPLLCLWALCLLCLAPAVEAAGSEPPDKTDMAEWIGALREQLSLPFMYDLQLDEWTVRPTETPPVASASPAQPGQDSEAWSRRLKDMKDMREAAEKEEMKTFWRHQTRKAALFLFALAFWGYLCFYIFRYAGPCHWVMRERNTLLLYRFTEDAGGPPRWDMDAALPPEFLMQYPECARKRVVIVYLPMPPHLKLARMLLRKWKAWRRHAARWDDATASHPSASAAGYGMRQRHIAWRKRRLSQDTKT